MIPLLCSIFLLGLPPLRELWVLRQVWDLGELSVILVREQARTVPANL